MQRFTPNDQIKLQKTALVMAAGNILTVPVYFFSFSAGFISSLLANVVMLFKFNSIGRDILGVQNLVNGVNNFFGLAPGQNIRTGVYNVIEGGASVYDELAPNIAARR